MQLTEAKITTIIYEKEDGTASSRVIIPVSVPKDLIRAIDLSDVELTERAEIGALFEEYKEYQAVYLKNMLTFEKWADHSHNKELTLKWRSFKTSGLR